MFFIVVGLLIYCVKLDILEPVINSYNELVVTLTQYMIILGTCYLTMVYLG